MPPDVPVIIDRSRTLPFKKVFEAIDTLVAQPQARADQLDAIVADLPDLEDIVLEGRSFHDGLHRERTSPTWKTSC